LTSPLRPPDDYLSMSPFDTLTLDRDLLAGANPRRDPALERRGRQVSSRRKREKLAAALDSVVARAERGGGGLTAAAPVQRESVLAARTQLGDLARRLRSDAEVDPQGVLLARRLLTDPAGALNSGAGPGSLCATVRQINAALDPRRA
jgi:hypothetical protein